MRLRAPYHGHAASKHEEPAGTSELTGSAASPVTSARQHFPTPHPLPGEPREPATEEAKGEAEGCQTAGGSGGIIAPPPASAPLPG